MIMCIYIYILYTYIYIIYIYIYWVYHGFAHWNNSFGASGSNKLLTKEARDLVNCSIKPSKFWANNFEEPLDGFIMFYPQMNTHDGWNRRLQVQTHVYIYTVQNCTVNAKTDRQNSFRSSMFDPRTYHGISVQQAKLLKHVCCSVLKVDAIQLASS